MCVRLSLPNSIKSLGKMGFWDDEIFEKQGLGKWDFGKWDFGKMRFGKIGFGENGILGNLDLGKCDLGNGIMGYGLGKLVLWDLWEKGSLGKWVLGKGFEKMGICGLQIYSIISFSVYNLQVFQAKNPSTNLQLLMEKTIKQAI